MERSPFLPLPKGMVIGQVEITQTQLTVEVISTQSCAYCPGCGNPSDSVSISQRFTTFHAGVAIIGVNLSQEGPVFKCSRERPGGRPHRRGL